MKVDPKASRYNDRHVKEDTAILPLEPKKVKYAKDKLLSFKLRTIPADADSPTYEMQMPINTGSETPRETIEWMKNLNKVFRGMNAAADAVQQDNLVRRTITDAAETAYNTAYMESRQTTFTAAREAALQASITNGDNVAAQQAAVAAVNQPDPTTLDVTAGVQAVMIYVTPYKGLQRQKRYMRRKCRKPADMSAREFFNHFSRMNWQELPLMPPAFNNTQCLQVDEIVDILMHAFPSSWNAEMERQGFDPFDHSPEEMLEFCERLEASETVNTPVKGNNKSNGSSGKKPHNKGSNKSDKGGDYYCMHHGKNTTHNTEDCRTLQYRSKKHKDGSGSSDSKGKHGNKTWSRKAEHYKDKSKKDLAALMRNPKNSTPSRTRKSVKKRKTTRASHP